MSSSLSEIHSARPQSTNVIRSARESRMDRLGKGLVKSLERYSEISVEIYTLSRREDDETAKRDAFSKAICPKLKSTRDRNGIE